MRRRFASCRRQLTSRWLREKWVKWQDWADHLQAMSRLIVWMIDAVEELQTFSTTSSASVKLENVVLFLFSSFCLLYWCFEYVVYLFNSFREVWSLQCLFFVVLFLPDNFFFPCQTMLRLFVYCNNLIHYLLSSVVFPFRSRHLIVGCGPGGCGDLRLFCRWSLELRRCLSFKEGKGGRHPHSRRTSLQVSGYFYESHVSKIRCLDGRRWKRKRTVEWERRR